MSCNRNNFASKLPRLNTEREPYIDAVYKYIDEEMFLFIRSIKESARLPLKTIQDYINADISLEKTATIDTIILELYGLQFRLQSMDSSDYVVVSKVIDHLIPTASISLQDEISRRGERFDGEDYNEIKLLYKIFPNDLLKSFILSEDFPAYYNDINDDHFSPLNCSEELLAQSSNSDSDKHNKISDEISLSNKRSR